MGARARKSLLERGGADVGRRILAASPSSRSRRRRPNEVGAQALGPSALLRRARDRGHHFFKIRRRPTPASRPLLLLLRPPLSSPPSPKSPRAAAALYSPLLSTELPTPVPCGAADEPTRTLRPGGRRWPRATPLPASSVSEREEGEKVLATGARSLYRRTRVEKVSRRRGAKVVVGSPTSARTRAMCSPVWPSGGGGGRDGRAEKTRELTALHSTRDIRGSLSAAQTLDSAPVSHGPGLVAAPVAANPGAPPRGFELPRNCGARYVTGNNCGMCSSERIATHDLTTFAGFYLEPLEYQVPKTDSATPMQLYFLMCTTPRQRIYGI
jgi:hypothetical protein